MPQLKEETNKGVIELISKRTSVSGNNCLGCIRHKKDIMITFTTGKEQWYDVFLDKEQAAVLCEELKNKL